MKIIENVTGQTSIVAQPITKSTGTLIFASTATLAQLATTTITIEIERQVGKNVYLATDANLRSLLLLALHAQNDVLLKDPTGTLKTFGIIELGLESGIKITTNDKIKVRLDGCDATKVYDLSAVEDKTATLSHINLEKKTVSADEPEKTFDVSEFVSVCFEVPAGVREIGFKTGNDEKRFTPFELRALMLQDRPSINPAEGTVLPDGTLVLDIIDIDFLTVYKNTANPMSLTFFNYKELERGTGSNYSSATAPQSAMQAAPAASNLSAMFRTSRAAINAFK